MNYTIDIKTKKTDPLAQLPIYATDGSGCFDIFTIEPGIILPKGSLSFKTGLSFEVPEDFVMSIFSRSGHGFKNGIRLSNSVGILDSDYRGSLMVKLHNDSTEEFRVKAGDRIAQACLIRAPKCNFIEVNELSETIRGEGGFGSTNEK